MSPNIPQDMRLLEAFDKLPMEAARIAKVYGQRPDIYRRLSWEALVQLSSPSLPAVKRKQFEARIVPARISRAERSPAPGGRSPRPATPSGGPISRRGWQRDQDTQKHSAA